VEQRRSAHEMTRYNPFSSFFFYKIMNILVWFSLQTGMEDSTERLPDFWQPQTDNLLSVQLKPSDKEFKEVQKAFLQTLNTDLEKLPTSNITQIEANILSVRNMVACGFGQNANHLGFSP
jgi:hypothetical protein